MLYKLFKKNYQNLILLIFFLLFLFPQNNFAKISDKNAIRTVWSELPIMPGAPKYFIRTEKIEKKTKKLNNHPIQISDDILRKMLKQLSYKYDRDQKEILVINSKRRVYYPIKKSGLLYQVGGPARAEFISRYPVLKGKKKSHSFNYVILIYTFKIKHFKKPYR